jgi:hypothetical protein
LTNLGLIVKNTKWNKYIKHILVGSILFFLENYKLRQIRKLTFEFEYTAFKLKNNID